MFKSTTLCVALLFSFVAFSQDQATAPAAVAEKPAKTASGLELKSENDKYSYVIGINIGSNLKNDGLELDLSVMMEGINDALNGSETLTRGEQMALMQNFQTVLMEKRKAKAEAEGKINAELARKFLEENKTKEGVITTASGLQYKVLKTENSEKKPSATDKVKVNYVARLLDGTEFDSSFQRGKPAEFGCNMLIPGWSEALQLMAVGDKFMLFIPPQLAYGENPQGAIPSNALLIFEVELLEIL